jgi:hypothetical protein
MENKQTKFEVKVNYDYTISIVDPRGREIRFRDLRGYDLEFLDHVFKYDPATQKNNTSLTFEDVRKILELLVVGPPSTIGKLTRPAISSIFDAVRDHILCNYLPKVVWLKYCYGLQNSSFANLEQMESVPMSKFSVMAEIHKEAVDSINKDSPDVQTDSGN